MEAVLMKKYVSLLLCLALVLSLAACREDPQDYSGSLTPTDPPGETFQSATEASTEATAEAPVSLGQMEGGVYENSYAGFGCALDSSWVFYGADVLQELPGAVKDMLEGSDMGDALEGTQQLTDMMAENADLMASMNLLYQKQDLASRLAAAAMTEADFVDGVLTQKDSMISAYNQMGITVDSMERAQVSFLGESRWAIYTVGSNQGVPLYMVQLFDFTKGSFALTLTISTFLEDNTAQVLDLFYKVG